MKMTFLYLKGCGHAMAALTRAALSDEEAAAPDDPEEASPEVTALVGDALPVRGFLNLSTNTRNATQFAIPANELATLTLQRNDDQLLSPRAYAIVEERPVELSAGVPAPTPAVDATDASILNIQLTADVVADQHIMLHVVPVAGTAGEGTFFHGVFVHDGASKRNLSFRMGAPLSGQYDVLVLMADRRPAVAHLTAP